MYFAPLRGLFIDVPQNRKRPLTERMPCLGVLIRRLQKEGWTVLDPDRWVEQAALLVDFGVIGETNILGNRDMYLLQNIIYRFVSVSGCKDEATKERLFHMIVMSGRATLHNRKRFNGFQEQLFKHDSSTLAHMAFLLRWD